ncbi:hypothetical protein [Paraburkholderia sartisoli]|uniref:Uncharacterized protein n=1 Tax=Paraburkholderia sartisoli TaxID=83784 RepID=A0A1H4G0J6_9BURK|nr:hypothetical protein [Paraburkholderia sartisoli]SEB03095.1 hypothetical protein SAMN05192564_105227 [Paraburkholderia sartisoli]
MNAANNRRNKFLMQRLQLLIDEYGFDTALSALEGLAPEHSVVTRYDNQKREKTPSRKSRRPAGMVGLVDALEGNDKKKALLLALASRFDEKAFLPSVSDVRLFMETRGEHPQMKQRSDAMRPILQLLAEMSTESLEKLKSTDTSWGLSRLGPLADAIRERGAEMRSDRPKKDIVSQTGSEDGKESDGEPRNRSDASPDSDAGAIKEPEGGGTVGANGSPTARD